MKSPCFQILSDLALQSGDLQIAYDGYTHGEKPATRATPNGHIGAALANDVTAALRAANLLKSIAPEATLDKIGWSKVYQNSR